MEALRAGGETSSRQWVHDKKLLWRANLYIDEGINDWNNLNPWNAPLAENEWNHTESDPATVSNGGQVISISDWTRYHDDAYFTIQNTSVTNHVPYTSGNTDSPFDANSKLLEQKTWTADAYNVAGIKFLQPKSSWPPGKITIADFNQNEYITYVQTLKSGQTFPADAISLPSWNSTFAPSRVWDNYIGVYTSGDRYPYRPNFSAITKWVLGTYTAEDPRKSVGVDCSGFLQRCASYPNNPYLVGNMNYAFTWTGGVDRLQGPGGFMSNSILIWEDSVSDTGLYNDTAIPLNVIPGDILVFYNGETYYHVAMVAVIKEHSDGSPHTRSDVVLIESAAGIDTKQYYVMNNQTWWQWRSVPWASGDTIYLRRLKVGN